MSYYETLSTMYAFDKMLYNVGIDSVALENLITELFDNHSAEYDDISYSIISYDGIGFEMSYNE